MSSKENFSHLKPLRKVREEDSSSEDGVISKLSHNRKRNNLNTELMRIRMEMDEFVEMGEK